MITFNVQLDEKDRTPNVYVTIPLGEYLLDKEGIDNAKAIIRGIETLVGNAHDMCLFINQEPARTRELRDIVEKYKSLYFLKLFEEIIQQVEPIKNSPIRDVLEKIEPLIEESKMELTRERYW